MLRQVADLDRRIGLQIEALERDIEPELIGRRIAELRTEKEQIEATLPDLAPDSSDTEQAELVDSLSRLPDLSQALLDAPLDLKRQVFDAFELRVVYDKPSRRVEITATVSEAVAKAFQGARDLPTKIARVTHKDIAGAGFEPATFGL